MNVRVPHSERHGAGLPHRHHQAPALQRFRCIEALTVSNLASSCVTALQGVHVGDVRVRNGHIRVNVVVGIDMRISMGVRMTVYMVLMGVRMVGVRSIGMVGVRGIGMIGVRAIRMVGVRGIGRVGVQGIGMVGVGVIRLIGMRQVQMVGMIEMPWGRRRALCDRRRDVHRGDERRGPAGPQQRTRVNSFRRSAALVSSVVPSG